VILIHTPDGQERSINIDHIQEVVPNRRNSLIRLLGRAKPVPVRGSFSEVCEVIRIARLGRLAPHTAAICEAFSEALRALVQPQEKD
jgi:hypothetical protein